MVYSYPYSLARRAIVAAADLSAKNLHMLRTNHWLKNPRNVLVLRLTGSTWEGEAPQVQLSTTETMSSWSVEEVGSFFNSMDACGIAAVLQANSVNGSDLLLFQSAEQLVEDLRLTPFAARKVLALRTTFLDQGA